jgi:type IV secretory pathway VirB2 component (pilin)
MLVSMNPIDSSAGLLSAHDSALLSALDWVQTLLLGTIGTTLASLAIAFIGFSMLRGMFSLRDGARVITGIFILFGAPIIARGLTGAPQSEPVRQEIIMPPTLGPSSAKVPASTNSNPFDPYLGRH